MDWDLGHYEHTAAQLLPAADAVVARAAPRADEHILDLGCGTGNAARLAAALGARVTGVDPSPRLLDVARTSVAGTPGHTDFVVGEAGAVPLTNGSVDAVVSVFGVIFAPDAAAAAAEMSRVLARHGRIVLSAWLPAGALADQARLRSAATAATRGEPARIPPFAWHDAQSLEALLAPHGFSIAVRQSTVAFVAASPQDFAEGELRDHPLWVGARAVLEPLGTWPSVCARTLQLFADANEDPDAFLLTSRYVVACAQRGV